MRLKNEELFEKPMDQLDEFLAFAREESWRFYGKKIKTYYPKTSFPTISITGENCSQNCLYCNKHYLKNMLALTTPERLRSFAFTHAAKKGIGMLISGGYNDQAQLPFEPFVKVLMEIKTKTDLILNLHPGLVTRTQAQILAEIGIDAVSYDLVVDDQVINEVINNGYTAENYKNSYRYLKDEGLKVIPHICLGLYFGQTKGNLEAIEFALQQKNTDLIVFLGLIPTRNTPMKDAAILDPEFLAKIIVYTRLKQPNIEQSLGCMRVRKNEYEINALKAGINRIAIPKKNTIEYAKNDLHLKIEENNFCCAI
ncbi:MAG: radical SAM protein [Candidatus Heimdallarchaeota archaeon]|nr:radical SAM protein [Candidatus Heimdallarchaeota archaeon]